LELDAASFRTAALAVLRRWHEADFPTVPWAGTVALLEDRRSGSLVPGAERKAIKALVDRALDQLAGNRPDLAALLRDRFGEQATIGEVAQAGRQTPDQVRHQQAAALDALAQVLASIESEAERSRRERILARLDVENPPRLFGQSGKQAEALATLRRPEAPWIVVLEGLGGLGKTALADALVRSLIAAPDFVDIIWLSARQSYFSFATGARPLASRRAVGALEELMAELARVLTGAAGEGSLEHSSAVARTALQAAPYLVVVDNLETISDYQTLIPHLARLAGPSRFLITSRQSLRGTAGVYSIALDELARPDLIALVRHEAEIHGLPDLAGQPDEVLGSIYEIVGGNPLAAKLVVGQAHTFDLDVLIRELREARGQPAAALYRHVYWHAWRSLSAQARQLLQIMPMVASTGGAIEQLVAASGLDHETTHSALRELVAASLVLVQGTVGARRYRIHGLTETFLMHEVLKWSSTVAPEA
jgi:hypothetical protein